MFKCSLLLLFLLPLAVVQSSPAFVEELLPAAEKTTLLYHLSYLCLANFPNLERNIRSRAVETQRLFMDSDATMLKCALTSRNLVHTLFPMVLAAAEKNTPELAVDHLKKAQGWIKEINNDVDRMAEKYELHNRDVASSVSDVIKEKHDTDARILEQSQELQQTEDTLNTLKSQLQSTAAELTQTEQKISKTQEFPDFVIPMDETSTELSILAAVVPLYELIGTITSIYDAAKNPNNNITQTTILDDTGLSNKKKVLKQKQSQLQLLINYWETKAAKASFDLNSIPDPIHLEEVQSSLTNIQVILIQLKHSWWSVSKVLGQLEHKTFVGEQPFLKDLSNIKTEFISSIQAVQEAWSSFGDSIERASAIFRQQTKDGFKFLEVSPSSLSKEQWQEEYERVKARLQKIEPSPSLSSTEKPAITE